MLSLKKEEKKVNFKGSKMKDVHFVVLEIMK